MAATYFIDWKGRRDGPYSLEQLAGLLESGDIGVLHRVETPTGLVPLRQLLLDADAKRWGHLKNKTAADTAAGAGAPSPNSMTANPIPLWAPAERNPAETAINRFPGHHSVSEIPDTAATPDESAPSILGVPPPQPPAGKPVVTGRRTRGPTGEPVEVLQAYAMSGLCFLFPPYFYWVWKSAVDFHKRGYLLAADRLRWIGLSLTVGGILFWLFLWGVW